LYFVHSQILYGMSEPFQSKRKTLTFTQKNSGNPEKIFPLLCQEREKEWLDGWMANTIYSMSGFAELNAVFETFQTDTYATIWIITHYDKEKYEIGFSRHTPGESVVNISINLEPISESQTFTHISYEYTALSEDQNCFIEDRLDHEFLQSMEWWEKAINHYLQTGKMLKKVRTTKKQHKELHKPS